MLDLPVRLLIVEDDLIVRTWMRAAFEGSEIAIVGETANVNAVPEILRRRKPDLLLIDHRLRHMTGTDLLRSLRRAGLSARAILMTANPEPGFNERAREAGAQGTVLKSGSAGSLLSTLHQVAGGRVSFDPGYPRRNPVEAALSPRELEVLRLVAAGMTNSAAALHLNVTEETIKTYLQRIYLKLGVGRRAEAVFVAQERRII